METTTTTAVENKGNVISSFFNLAWQKGNRAATILAILMTGVLIGIVYYGLHQPHYQISIVRLGLTNLIFAGYISLFAFTGFVLVLCLGVTGIIIFACGIIYGYDNIAIMGLGIFLISSPSIIAKYLWDKHRKYFPLFAIILLVINSWLIFSSLSKPNPNFDWFSRANGKIAGEEMIIPLGFMDLEDKYFPVAKLEPVEIPVKISILNPEEAGWKVEKYFSGNIHVEFQPQNYEVYRAILEHGDFQQITVRATSIEEARRLVMKEISSQSGLHFGKFEIIMSGIGS